MKEATGSKGDGKKREGGERGKGRRGEIIGEGQRKERGRHRKEGFSGPPLPKAKP